MCGIIGIFGRNHVAQELYDGLIMLQHRGQDAAGIVTYNDHFHVQRGLGLAQEVFTQEYMEHLLGNVGIAHVRYTTAGSSDDPNESQPFFVNAPFGISLIHNGNLTNYEFLRDVFLKKHARHLNTGSDSEALVNVLAASLQALGKSKLSPADVFKATTKTMQTITGSYSVICILGGEGLLAFRDPTGNRPLILGSKTTNKGEQYIIASETVAFDVLGYRVIKDVQAGEAVFIDRNGKVHFYTCVQGILKPCIFEFVYLARPDSVIDKISVYKSRLRMGMYLAKQIKASKIKMDVVVPVPDTSRSAALSLAQELNVKYREGLIKNRYIGRTFIMPNQSIRKKSIRYKLNAMVLELRGKSVLLVDDSIVRGNTSRKIIQLVRQAGAKKVYFASTAPPLKFPCVYGVDIPSKKELIASGLSIEEVCKFIGADKLFYQTLPDLIKSAKEGNKNVPGFCTACFDGKYPTPEVDQALLNKVELARGACDVTKESIDGDELAEAPQLLI